jgi:hypothetical protein
MDPAVAALDFAKAGAILADMVESFLAADIPASLLEGADHDDVKENGPAPVTSGLHLHSPVDAGTGALQSSAGARAATPRVKGESPGGLTPSPSPTRKIAHYANGLPTSSRISQTQTGGAL